MKYAHLVFLVIFVLSLLVYPWVFYGYDKEKAISGSVEAEHPESSYGFGEDKRLLIFDLTEIGDAENIDMSDKKFAKLKWSSVSKGTHESTIGIEIKGSGFNERFKINLAFEFWEPKDDGVLCTSIETCDDSKEEMFEFGEDYEDYVLRGGWHEQTFIRDVVASEFVGGILQKDLVEVLFKFGDKLTYEGVYILQPAIQRRVLEKRLDWDLKGKAEDCDDSDYDINEVSLIIEHTIESKGRKQPCEIFEDYSVKMRYPKCDFYDEEEIKPCRDEYMNRTNHFASVINWKNETPVALDLESFANHYLAEMLMRQDDFPHTSQYFYVSPDSVMYSGPRWDYDLAYWKIGNKYSWNIIDLGYYSQGVIKLWKKLGKKRVFIDLVKTKKDTVIQNREIVLNLIEERREQFKKGYFDKEIERWGMFGKKRQSDYVIYLAYRAWSKETPELELDYMKHYFETRSKWMEDNIESFDGYQVSFVYVWTHLLVLTIPLWLSFIVGVVMIISHFAKKNSYSRVYNEE